MKRLRARPRKILQKGDRIKQLPSVHQKRRERDHAKAYAARQKRNQHKLKRARIHRKADQQRDMPFLPRLGHHHSIRHAHKRIAAQNRNRAPERLAQRRLRHSESLPSSSIPT